MVLGGLYLRLESEGHIFCADDAELELCVPEGEVRQGFHPASHHAGSSMLLALTWNATDPVDDLDCLRVIPSDSSDDQCYSLIRRWLRECSEHDSCPMGKAVPLPRRVIVVPRDASERPRPYISSKGDMGHYIALSHCWGTSSILKLNQSATEDVQPGIDITAMPQI